eukprot:CAMPEP_0170464096 /NCGR_PEP_ID=MMETSP0123-20130129/8956_1 /TAXON_ID=182087 /ORGANISM="Favella ehrenbergii, Strain Fehren 1" /LENGTH=42 /DNA_ID= /DNA_START= /DNA_END= /DNA_ORIENTATION=
MKEDEFKQAKAELAKKVSTLLQMGTKLVKDKKNLSEYTRKMW